MTESPFRRRELRVVRMADRAVVHRVDVTGLLLTEISDRTAKLRATMNDEEFYIEDTGDKGPLEPRR
jgi:hypothetical protein